MKTSIYRFSLSFALALGVGAVAVPALAARTGELSGNACETVYSSESSVSTMLYRDNRGIQNNDTVNYKTLICPLRRVDPQNASGVGLQYLEVFYTDGSGDSTHGVDCSLIVTDRYGNTITTVAEQRTAFGTAAGQGAVYFSNAPTSSLANYALICNLYPNFSRLAAYKWIEL